MTGKELAEMAFRTIQNDPTLWAKWHDVKTQTERDYMMLEVVASMSWQRGYDQGKNDPDFLNDTDED